MCQHALDRSRAKSNSHRALISNKLANCKLAAQEMIDSRPIIKRWLALFSVSTSARSGTSTPMPAYSENIAVPSSSAFDHKQAPFAFDSPPLPAEALMDAVSVTRRGKCLFADTWH
jgi:hypothetical protein